jgi:hypothetical protein
MGILHRSPTIVVSRSTEFNPTNKQDFEAKTHRPSPISQDAGNHLPKKSESVATLLDQPNRNHRNRPGDH